FSFLSSLSNACFVVSFSSIFPSGNSHKFGNDFSAFLFAHKIFPSCTITAPTTRISFFILNPTFYTFIPFHYHTGSGILPQLFQINQVTVTFISQSVHFYVEIFDWTYGMFISKAFLDQNGCNERHIML